MTTILRVGNDMDNLTGFASINKLSDLVRNTTFYRLARPRICDGESKFNNGWGLFFLGRFICACIDSHNKISFSTLAVI